MSCTRHLSPYLNTSRCVIAEMLQARGYDVSSLASFVPAVTNGDNLEPIKLTKSNESIEVHYNVSTTRTNHKTVTSAVNAIIKSRDVKDKSKDLTIVFLVCDNVTPSVKEAIRVLTKDLSVKGWKVFIQIFPIRQLMYNITKHKMVPEHVRIPKTEYDKFLPEFLDSLHIDSLERLPKILDSDPMAMFMGLKPGEMCKIVRPSQSAGKHVVYRYCVMDY